jgi:hypothetical protein
VRQRPPRVVRLPHARRSSRARARLRERLQLTKSQFDDLAELLRSQLDISLIAILRGP